MMAWLVSILPSLPPDKGRVHSLFRWLYIEASDHPVWKLIINTSSGAADYQQNKSDRLACK